MTCPWCGRPLVEVDNPFRREVRHRRGEETTCPGPPRDGSPTVAETKGEDVPTAGLFRHFGDAQAQARFRADITGYRYRVRFDRANRWWCITESHHRLTRGAS